jgi:hypothetical protein
LFYPKKKQQQQKRTEPGSAEFREGRDADGEQATWHTQARGDPSFSSTASALFPRLVRGRMEKQSRNLVGGWARFTLPCSQQPANPPLDLVHGRRASRSVFLCRSCTSNPSKNLGWSRKIRCSVPTDKRVRHERARRTTEQGNEAISVGLSR